MEILSQGFDHVEYVLNQIRPMSEIFERLGFEKIGERHLSRQGTRTVAYAQGLVRVLLTEASPVGSHPSVKSESMRFLNQHAEGICVLALEVKDATAAFHESVRKGARPARAPEVFKTSQGTVVRSEIFTPGDVRYAFIERSGIAGSGSPGLFDEELMVARFESTSPLGIRLIDHLTNNVGMGEMKNWVKYYQDVFGFSVTRHFDIRTDRTGLLSDVVESSDHRIKVPINEPTEPESQIQEFVNRMKGAGIQHLAFLTLDLQKTLRTLRQRDFRFLSVPHTYYEEVPTRVPGVTEDLQDLEDLGILLDGDSNGYLLQIFSEEILGPFFFEYIQRKGNRGFGEGNFRALFEAMERDQIRRGVLKASTR